MKPSNNPPSSNTSSLQKQKNYSTTTTTTSSSNNPPQQQKPPKSSTVPLVYSTLGTLTTLLSLATLYISIATPHWITLQEPIFDPNELEKLNSYDSDYLTKPQILKAKLGLFKTCIGFRNDKECFLFDYKRFLERGELFIDHYANSQHGNYGNNNLVMSELVVGCVNRVRLTLPFILASVLFTTLAFFTLIFGSFCQKTRKIVEASLLILAGLCQATALLTFVSQIGSEFESQNNYFQFDNGHQSNPSNPQLSTHLYRYKYGYSFYLFLLSFSLSELAALFDMASYFKKQKAKKYSQEIMNSYHGNNLPLVVEEDETGFMNDNCNDFIRKHPDICEFSISNSDFVLPLDTVQTDVELGNWRPNQQGVCYYGTGGRNTGGNNKMSHLESFATMGRSGGGNINGCGQRQLVLPCNGGGNCHGTNNELNRL